MSHYTPEESKTSPLAIALVAISLIVLVPLAFIPFLIQILSK